MCPEGRPGRGSGSVPRNLHIVEWDIRRNEEIKLPPARAGIKDKFRSRVELGAVRCHLLTT